MEHSVDRPDVGTRLSSWVHGACVAAVFACAAHAEQANIPVASVWGFRADGICDVPSSTIGTVRLIRGGSFHSVAITQAGGIVAWGDNLDGQCNMPDTPLRVIDASCGAFFTAILLENGTVTCSGSNDRGQCDVPEDLTDVTRVVAGDLHVLALKQDGSIVGWGSNQFGQLDVPADIGVVVDLAAGAYHNVARRADGSVRAWGYNDNGETAPPTDLGAVTQVACGGFHNMSLRTDGTVRGWGLNGFTQASTPPGLRSVLRVAAGAYHSAALRDDGFVVAWGYNAYGQCVQPLEVGAVKDIAAGGYHTIAIFEGDCDASGTLDAQDIADGEVDDFNGNLQPDACDLARGFEEDCNGNAVIDSHEQGLYAGVYTLSQELGPIGDGVPQTWNYESVSLAVDDVFVNVWARGDFSAPGEWLSITLNGRYLGKVFTSGSDKNDCRFAMGRTIVIPRHVFNEFIGGPGGATIAEFGAEASVAVNAQQCTTGSWVQFEVWYTAATTGDCNANSLLDVCEIEAHPEYDLNSDGVLDACQGNGVVFWCPGDLDQNLSVNSADLSLLLMGFGAAMPGDPADLDGDGAINNADVSVLLLLVGDCG